MLLFSRLPIVLAIFTALDGYGKFEFKKKIKSINFSSMKLHKNGNQQNSSHKFLQGFPRLPHPW